MHRSRISCRPMFGTTQGRSVTTTGRFRSTNAACRFGLGARRVEEPSRISGRQRYRDLEGPSQPAVRSTILGRLMEIEQTTATVITGITPNAFQWGTLTPATFL